MAAGDVVEIAQLPQRHGAFARFVMYGVVGYACRHLGRNLARRNGIHGDALLCNAGSFHMSMRKAALLPPYEKLLSSEVTGQSEDPILITRATTTTAQDASSPR
jgi:hypothetical protein